jgi:hypothetical protein
MLELAADLCLLHEPASHVGIVVPFLEQDLDGQVSPQIGIAAFEDSPHPAVADLAQDLVAALVFGHLPRRRPDDRRLDRRLDIAEQNARHLAEEALDEPKRACARHLWAMRGCHAGPSGARQALGLVLEALTQQAGRAEPVRRICRKIVATAGAELILGHYRDSRSRVMSLASDYYAAGQKT